MWPVTVASGWSNGFSMLRLARASAVTIHSCNRIINTTHTTMAHTLTFPEDGLGIQVGSHKATIAMQGLPSNRNHIMQRETKNKKIHTLSGVRHFIFVHPIRCCKYSKRSLIFVFTDTLFSHSNSAHICLNSASVHEAGTM